MALTKSQMRRLNNDQSKLIFTLKLYKFVCCILLVLTTTFVTRELYNMHLKLPAIENNQFEWKSYAHAMATKAHCYTCDVGHYCPIPFVRWEREHHKKTLRPYFNAMSHKALLWSRVADYAIELQHQLELPNEICQRLTLATHLTGFKAQKQSDCLRSFLVYFDEKEVTFPDECDDLYFELKLHEKPGVFL